MPRRVTKRLTLEQHKKIGFDLKCMQVKLWEIEKLIIETYGKSSRCSSDAFRVWNGMNRLRCTLDTALMQENQQLPNFCDNQELADYYYGTGKQEFLDQLEQAC